MAEYTLPPELHLTRSPVYICTLNVGYADDVSLSRSLHVAVANSDRAVEEEATQLDIPVLEYGHVLLVGCNKEQERLIERVQRRALRIISLGGRREVPPLPTLKERREVAAVKLLKNMLDEGHPLHDLVPPVRKTATGRTLRNGAALTVPAARTKRLKNSFLHKAIRLYNESL
ncbi:hypothetical protein Bbelb_114800 [Branchiostoma belcheri]|nr:hypothetical protein Bbelb_114800 [Branchiostoma belcheri]